MPEPRRSIGINQTGNAEKGLAGGSCYAWLSTAQTIPNAAFTTISYDAVDWNVLGFFQIALGRYVPLLGGVYRLSCFAQFSSVPINTWIYLEVVRNGVPIALLDSRKLGAAESGGGVGGTTLVRANGKDDYFEIGVFQDSGAGRTLNAAIGGNYLCAEMVGRL